MTAQLDLFAARDEAIARVDQHADEAWKQHALTVIASTAWALGEFTTDDVWDRLDPAYSTHEPRALGALMKAMATRGVITPTQQYRTSKRSECHNRPVRVWRAA